MNLGFKNKLVGEDDILFWILIFEMLYFFYY